MTLPWRFVASLAPALTLLGGCSGEDVAMPPEPEGGGIALVLEEGPAAAHFRSEAVFQWRAMPEGRVGGYQYQFVEADSEYMASAGQRGRVLRSLDPPADNPAGSEDREFFRWTAAFGPERTAQIFRELPDSGYEFRIRAVDADGVVTEPVRARFSVELDDVPPLPTIDNVPRCGRIGTQTSYQFLINATDERRNGSTPRSRLEYSVRLLSWFPETCPERSSVVFTPWRSFPDNGSVPVVIGDAPPDDYDLFSRSCRWTFTLRVRDPAGNIASTECEIATE